MMRPVHPHLLLLSLTAPLYHLDLGFQPNQPQLKTRNQPDPRLNPLQQLTPPPTTLTHVQTQGQYQPTPGQYQPTFWKLSTNTWILSWIKVVVSICCLFVCI